MALKDFIKAKKEEIIARKKSMPLLQLKEKIKTTPTRNFLRAFNKGFTIIGEIKKASPSASLLT
jgi:indole-3-glycerol phosphate synthase